MTDLDALLLETIAAHASDLHLAAGRQPFLRCQGELMPHGQQVWDDEVMQALIDRLLGTARVARLQQTGSADLGYTTIGGDRFRINVFRSLGRLALVARHLPERFASLGELRLPEHLRELAYLGSGLVLVTGVTGSGKSTSLATLIHEINTHCARHILTVEDPVEFVHRPLRSVVSHREVGTDTPDFASAVKAAMREDPDVILVGEMRDTETMRAALVAAETGHLVFSTLHTADATGTVERFVGAFPGEEQSLARHRLSMVLKAAVSQQLLPRSGGVGRVPAVEVLRVTPAISNLIASGRSNQIYSAIESGMELGMQTFDQSLALLVQERLVDADTARPLGRDRHGFDNLVACIRQRQRP